MIGIDLVKVERIAEAIKSERFLTRVFTSSEIEYANKKTDKNQTFAGIFAAKEAVIKAVGGDCAITCVEILHDEKGRPQAVVNGQIIEVSISHDGGFAVAVAMALK